MTANYDNEIVNLSADLFDAVKIDQYFNVVGKFVPRLFGVDFYNLITVLKASDGYRFHRNFSPDFPVQIFINYERETSQYDLMLKEAMATPVRGIVHVEEIKKKYKDPPKQWLELLKFLEKEISFVDSVAIVLSENMTEFRHLKTGLVLYRQKPRKAFGKEDLKTINLFAPLLSKAFERIWVQSMKYTSLDIFERIFSHEGNLCFTVDGRGFPILMPADIEQSLNVLFHRQKSHKLQTKLPFEIQKTITELIKVLRVYPQQTLVSKDISSTSGSHRIYLSKLDDDPNDPNPLYFTMFVCDPELNNLDALAEEGFTRRELQILEFLQTGLSNVAIANTLSISRPTVKFHLQNLSQKLNASGRTEILAKALALSRQRILKTGLVKNTDRKQR